MQLIQDVFVIEKLQVLNEGKNKGPMRIRGIFGRCNEKNNNGRIYPSKVLENQIKKLEPLLSERRLCGELDHPTNDSVKLSNASHLITKLELKGNELIGEAEILNTPAGLTAKALIEGGVRIGISSRGMGTLSEDEKGDKVVNEDFNLVTFDLVADPSTRGAFPSLTESTQTKFVKNKLTKLQKERNFVKLLESKIRTAYAEEEVIQERKAPKAKKMKKIKKEIFPEHSLYLNIGKLLSEDFTTEYAKELERIKQRRKFPSAPKSFSIKNSDDLGAIRKHAKKMQIARAKGREKAADIEQKGAILRARRNDRALQGKPVFKRDYIARLFRWGSNKTNVSNPSASPSKTAPVPKNQAKSKAEKPPVPKNQAKVGAENTPTRNTNSRSSSKQNPKASDNLPTEISPGKKIGSVRRKKAATKNTISFVSNTTPRLGRTRKSN